MALSSGAPVLQVKSPEFKLLFHQKKKKERKKKKKRSCT
jgi:hypothetical protein